MADDRISKLRAELVAIPPTTWYVKKVSWVLEQESIIKNIENVPLNQKLMDSLKKDKMINPILTMNQWYPIVGSQRIRACKEIQKLDPTHPILDQEIRIARFDADYWNMFYLWGDENFRHRAIAIWFQTVELAWKSIHYIYDTDFSGTDMKEFERIGDQLVWNLPDGVKEKYKSIRTQKKKYAKKIILDSDLLAWYNFRYYLKFPSYEQSIDYSGIYTVMAFTQRDLSPLVRGDDWTIKLALTSGSSPLDITGYTFWFTLKDNIDEVDPGDLQVTATPDISSSPTEASQGIIYIKAARTATNGLEPKNYNYDVQQVDTLGNVQTLLIGKVKVVKDITRSTSQTAQTRQRAS